MACDSKGSHNKKAWKHVATESRPVADAEVSCSADDGKLGLTTPLFSILGV